MTSWKHYIAGGSGPVAVYTRKSSGVNEIHYLTRDHLGSVDSVTNGSGAIEVRLSFASFGQRRNEAGWSGNPPSGDWTQITATTRRGFTFHEMLDNLSLTHMNGRVYDQVVGRFLSADPFVQAPGLTQSFNRYSYVWNNPLSFTDPSGFSTDTYVVVHCKDNCGGSGAPDMGGVTVMGGRSSLSDSIVGAILRLYGGGRVAGGGSRVEPAGDGGGDGVLETVTVTDTRPKEDDVPPPTVDILPGVIQAGLAPSVGEGGGNRKPQGDKKNDSRCGDAGFLDRLGDALAKNTEGRLGFGLGLGAQGKGLFANVNVEAGHFYMGGVRNLAGQSSGYISAGGPGFEAQFGKLVVGFSTGQHETRFAAGRVEEMSQPGFFGFRWADNNGFGEFGGRGKLTVLDIGLETDLWESVQAACDSQN